MVPDHWSNDAMVSMDRCGLAKDLCDGKIHVSQFMQLLPPKLFAFAHLGNIQAGQHNSKFSNCIQHSRIKPVHELQWMAINTAIDLCDGKIHVSQFVQLLPQTIRFCTCGQYPSRTAQLKILQLHSAFQNKTLLMNCYAWQ